MSSASSTEPRPPASDAGFQPWQFFMLLSMAAATAAVLLSRHTHPVALLLISGAIFAAGLVAVTVHHAVTGFLGARRGSPDARLSTRTRQAIEQDKAIVLRSIKELEFDRAMRKVSDLDFNEISTRLRSKALVLIEELDRDAQTTRSSLASVPTASVVDRHCSSCGLVFEEDARFCKQCGARLA